MHDCRKFRMKYELKETIGGLFENQKYRIEIKRVALDDHLNFSGIAIVG